MTDEQIEQYSLGNSSEAETAAWEEHLLLCGRCRRQVDASDTYVKAMAEAASRLRNKAPARRPRVWGWRLVPAFAGLAVVIFAVLGWIGSMGPTPAPIAVSLAVSRGPGLSARAPAGRPLQLTPDLTGLREWPSYRLEIVDRYGAPVWEGSYPGSPAGPLSSGTYFVRISSPAGELYREYGLEVRKALP